MNVYELNTCPDCASMNVVHSKVREQLICRDCGLIYQPLAPQMEKRFKKEIKPIAVREIKPAKKKKAAKPAKKAKKKVKKAVKKKAVKKKPAKKAKRK